MDNSDDDDTGKGFKTPVKSHGDAEDPEVIRFIV
jgi:hypothetical protein